jgi:L-amino acid N-acyltransferase YncA
MEAPERIRNANEIVVREAESADMERVQAIYAYYVEKTAFSFEEEA